MPNSLPLSHFADIKGVSRRTVETWVAAGKYTIHADNYGRACIALDELESDDDIREMLHSPWEEEATAHPVRPFTNVELFAGAGGLAIGMEMAGFRHVLLNEIDHDACSTLRTNRPQWNVVEADVHCIDFSPLHGRVDLLTGGFPCQAFSFAGNKGGFNDTRGTLFFELARAVKQIAPRVFLCENVRGLASHDGGKTLAVIRNTIAELGYTLVEPRILAAIKYRVPQKRERIFLVAIRNDLAPLATFRWPAPYHRLLTLRDAFFAGELYPTDVPPSAGQSYPEKKRRVLEQVPMGGDWRDLPEQVAKDYMGGSYHLGGGKTGMARRLSLDEPSLTLTCAPAQKQTERCHPTETRPLTIREYARIQTFPDEWTYCGNTASQYKQIGNAVPCNLAHAVGRSLVRLLNDLEAASPQTITDAEESNSLPVVRGKGLFYGELF